MKVYDIETDYIGCQKHCVVAESFGEAERVFLAKYWPTTIKEIRLHSVYVQIQKFDEQAKEKK